MADILVPLDGSALARSALPLAGLLARSMGHRLKLLRVVLPVMVLPESLLDETEYVTEVDTRSVQEEAAALRQRYGVPVTAVAKSGLPADVVLEEAADPEAAFIVMATHGRSGLPRLALGSVAEQMLREAPIPVFLIPATAARSASARLRRILVPFDGSDLAYAVLGPVSDLAKRLDAEIVLLRVVAEPTAGSLWANGQTADTAGQQAKRLKAMETSPARASLVRLALIFALLGLPFLYDLTVAVLAR